MVFCDTPGIASLSSTPLVPWKWSDVPERDPRGVANFREAKSTNPRIFFRRSVIFNLIVMPPFRISFSFFLRVATYISNKRDLCARILRLSGGFYAPIYHRRLILPTSFLELASRPSYEQSLALRVTSQLRFLSLRNSIYFPRL